MWKAAVFVALVTFSAFAEDGAIYLQEESRLREDFALTKFASLPFSKSTRVAVIDIGFAGIDPNNPSLSGLPAGTELIASYPGVKSLPLLQNELHGGHTSRAIWGLTGRHASIAMKLYNGRGQTNFLEAMAAAEKWDAQVIYIGFTVPTLNNFSGDGEMDAAIARAVARGAIVIVPAGNYGKMAYDRPIEFKEADSGKWVQFAQKDGTKSYYLEFRNNFDENEVTITASWAYKSNSSAPPQDLGLYLYLADDKTQKQELVKSVNKTQVLEADEDLNHTRNAMELIQSLRLKAYSGKTYRIAVAHFGGEFTAKDRIRIALSASKGDKVGDDGKIIPGIEFLNLERSGEIMNLADSVAITVGDYSDHSSRGPTRDGRSKPDIVLDKNAVQFSDLHAYAGSTVSSVFMAGIATVFKAHFPSITQREILALRSKVTPQLAKLKKFSEHYPGSYGSDLKQLILGAFGENTYYDYNQQAGWDKAVTLSSLARITTFSTFPKSVQDNPEKYSYQLFVKDVPSGRTQIVKDPDTQEWVPGEQRLVRKGTPGRYKQESYTINETQQYGLAYNFGGIAIDSGYRYNLTVPTKKYRTVWDPGTSDEYKYIPGYYKTIPGQTRREAVPPERSLDMTYLDRATGQPPKGSHWGYKIYNVEVEQAKLPKTDNAGLVIDGSDQDPKFWVPPTPQQVQQVLKESGK